jgi:hypothetical protein
VEAAPRTTHFRVAADPFQSFRAVTDSRNEAKIQLEIENDLRDQIAHNIKKGVLKSASADEVKYSWRGMVYLWCQFLLDLVRL